MKKLHFSKIKVILILSLCLTFVLSGFSLYSCVDSMDYNDTPVKFREIIHAGGELWGYDSQGTYRSFAGSNSLEGLEQCASVGGCAVELDLSFTSDGRLVCIHDWSREYIDTLTEGEAPTWEEFKLSSIYWNFTPIDIDDAAEFLAEHPDMYIVTDIKERFGDAVSAVKQAFGEKRLCDRVVIQVYSEEEYNIAAGQGFENIIYSLYKLDWNSKTDVKSLVKFAKYHKLIGFTFAYELCNVPGYVDGMKKAGIPLYVHTVNDPAEAQKYLDMGIYGIYTDVMTAE